MSRTATAVRTLQAVALTVGLAVFLWGTGLPAFFQNVEAAALTSASDTLSNSAPSDSSVHTIGFTTASQILADDVLAITWPDTFDLSSLVFGDIAITVGGNATNTGDELNGNDTWGVTIDTHHIEFQAPDDTLTPTSSVFVITIGSESGTMIVNPAAVQSYPIGIGTDLATTTIADSAQVRVAIIDDVTVTASVDTTLEFAVGGVANAQSVNGTTTTQTSTNTTIPFGSLSAGVPATLAQDLTVTTNAANGFSVTVVTDGDLESTTGATIDGFVNGSYTDTPTAWEAPGATPADPTTYGHWGLTTTDTNITGSGTWISPSSTPVTVFDAGGPLNASTTRVGYQVEISSLQEAGTDYTAQLRYIATPTF